MKKAVFTIQIFSLILMLPAYMILELNYTTAESRVYKTNSINRGNPVNQDSRVSESPEPENTNGLFGFKPKTSI